MRMIIENVSKRRLAVRWCIVVCLLASVYGEKRLNIIRGYTDKFTNPSCAHSSCDSTQGVPLTCAFFKAYCVTPECFECQCHEARPTFYRKESADGKCVKDEDLRLSLGESLSFLAYHPDIKICMLPHGIFVGARTCDINSMEQHWIWTKHNQLLNLYTLKCLQKSGITGFAYHGTDYPKVSLTWCNASDPRQTWQCKGRNGRLVRLGYEKTYLNYGNVRPHVILFSGMRNYSYWKRFKTKSDALCSTVSSYHGCYRYSDGSSMFTMKTGDMTKCKDYSNDCIKEKQIWAPIEMRNQYCYIQPEMTEFFNYTRWDNLPEILRAKLFKLVKTNVETIMLKVNVTASQHLSGQIIRLHIRCETGNHAAFYDQGRDNETHCVLIKFSGNFRTLFSLSQISTSPTTTATDYEIKTRNGSSTTLVTESTTPSAGEESQTSDGSSSTLLIIIIIVCLILLVLCCAAIVFVVWKRRSRGRKTHETQNDVYENHHISAVESADTLNPVYFSSNYVAATPAVRLASDKSDGYDVPVEAASNPCVLYESSRNESVYIEPGTCINNSGTDAQCTYDYALDHNK